MRATKYIIDYVCPVDAYGHQSYYHQLVRVDDNAILYANERLELVELECWKMGIDRNDVKIL